MSIPDGTTPFSLIDWSVPYPIRPSESFVDQAIWSFVVPFSQTYWPRTFYPQFPKEPITQALNLNLYKNAIPFGPFDYNKSAFPKYPKEPITQALNINLFVNKIPFGPFDWNRARWTPAAKESPNWSLNLNLFKNPIPALNLSFTAPFFPKPPVAPVIPYNLNLYTSGPVSIPFSQTDWPLTRRINGLPALSDQAIWAFTVPFAQYDWSKPFVQAPSIPRVYPVSLALTGPVGTPFSQTDWPQLPKQYFRSARIDGAIIDISQPFAQLDWSKPFVQPPSAGITNPPISIALTAPALPRPFAQYDWSKTVRVASLPPGSGPLNLNFYKNTEPFYQLDWSKPYAVAGLLPAPLPINLGLFPPPEPLPPEPEPPPFHGWTPATKNVETWSTISNVNGLWIPAIKNIEGWTNE